jgi:SAM-dependent MidA family methyltransferase
VLYGVIKIRLVEKNPHLREARRERLSWHEDISCLEKVEYGSVVSNELIDSLPFHRVVMDGHLKEIYTGFDGGKFRETIDTPSSDELSAYFKALGIELQQGQAAEVNLNGAGWIESAGRLFEKGFVITVDYGWPAKELYSPERGRGTFMCHFRHTLSEDPYANIGLQDITAHVDFTTLVNRGRSSGLELTGFTTQKNFLLGLGVLEELTPVDDPGIGSYSHIRRNQEISELIMPGGAGDTFKVLVQHKGIPRPALKGFSFKDMSAYL